MDSQEERIIKTMQSELPPDELLFKLSDAFKMFGDPSRLKIIFALMSEELCVSHLMEVVGMGQSAVSHQLKTLRSSKLVKSRRDGKNIYYSLDDEHVSGIIALAMEHLKEPQI